jgi:hypothetical protein
MCMMVLVCHCLGFRVQCFYVHDGLGLPLSGGASGNGTSQVMFTTETCEV